jgi:hypothetical protein
MRLIKRRLTVMLMNETATAISIINAVANGIAEIERSIVSFLLALRFAL